MILEQSLLTRTDVIYVDRLTVPMIFTLGAFVHLSHIVTLGLTLQAPYSTSLQGPMSSLMCCGVVEDPCCDEEPPNRAAANEKQSNGVLLIPHHTIHSLS